MLTLNKRNETYGLDLKIGQDMTNRAEVLNEKNKEELFVAFSERLLQH